jgi:hypothetical protein
VTPHRLPRTLSGRTVHQIDLGVGSLKGLEIAIRQQRQERLIVPVSGLGSGDMLLRQCDAKHFLKQSTHYVFSETGEASAQSALAQPEIR